MREIRRQRRKDNRTKELPRFSYIPLTFEAMLSHVHTTSERNNIRQRITNSFDGRQNLKDVVKKDVNTFLELFKSFDLDNSTNLHADNNYFLNNLHKIRKQRILNTMNN